MLSAQRHMMQEKALYVRAKKKREIGEVSGFKVIDSRKKSVREEEGGKRKLRRKKG